MQGGKRTRLNQMISEQLGTPHAYVPGRKTQTETLDDEPAVEGQVEAQNDAQVEGDAVEELQMEHPESPRRGLYRNPGPFARFATPAGDE